MLWWTLFVTNGTCFCFAGDIAGVFDLGPEQGSHNGLKYIHIFVSFEMDKNEDISAVKCNW